MSTITIDGKEYELEKLSDAAKAQLMSLQAADAKLNQLRTELNLIQTARNAYAQALAAELKKLDDEEEVLM